MKILFPFYPLHSGTFPSDKVQDGVVASCNMQIEALLAHGHEVTLIVTRDFEVNDSRVGVITGDFDSKELAGKTPWTPLTKKILEVESEFDVIILNMAELPMTNEDIRSRFENILPRVRVIYHHYDERAFSSFFVTQYQCMAWVKQNGGKVFTVSMLFNAESWYRFKKKDVITSNPYHNYHLPTTLEEFDHLDMTVALEPKEPLTEDGGYVMIGRASPEKNILLGIQAYCKTPLQEPLYVFTCPSSAKKEVKYFNSIMATQDDPRVHVQVSATREQILYRLSRARCVLYPSKKESFGLVAMEALSYGCDLIYSDSHAFFAKEEGKLVRHPTLKSFSEAIVYRRREEEFSFSWQSKKDRSEAFRDEHSLEQFQERYCFNLLNN